MVETNVSRQASIRDEEVNDNLSRQSYIARVATISIKKKRSRQFAIRDRHTISMYLRAIDCCTYSYATRVSIRENSTISIYYSYRLVDSKYYLKFATFVVIGIVNYVSIGHSRYFPRPTTRRVSIRHLDFTHETRMKEKATARRDARCLTIVRICFYALPTSYQLVTRVLKFSWKRGMTKLEIFRISTFNWE